jgi:hypothetical protein
MGTWKRAQEEKCWGRSRNTHESTEKKAKSEKIIFDLLDVIMKVGGEDKVTKK